MEPQYGTFSSLMLFMEGKIWFYQQRNHLWKELIETHDYFTEMSYLKKKINANKRKKASTETTC